MTHEPAAPTMRSGACDGACDGDRDGDGDGDRDPTGRRPAAGRRHLPLTGPPLGGAAAPALLHARTAERSRHELVAWILQDLYGPLAEITTAAQGMAGRGNGSGTPEAELQLNRLNSGIERLGWVLADLREVLSPDGDASSGLAVARLPRPA
ncbi:hypothetical protein ACIQF6_03135 [Kitasatospora sp. NPDC092948]|uniref:hypothetical protein n=1 Tax=Kitasatospora sp. NPDC092948 TaxID=3364088 RepID=UPI0037FE3132